MSPGERTVTDDGLGIELHAAVTTRQVPDLYGPNSTSMLFNGSSRVLAYNGFIDALRAGSNERAALLAVAAGR